MNEFWRELIKQSQIEDQYDVLVKRGDMSDREIAIALARFAEAHIFAAANRRITELEAKVKTIGVMPQEGN